MVFKRRYDFIKGIFEIIKSNKKRRVFKVGNLHQTSKFDFFSANNLNVHFFNEFFTVFTEV